jgi:plastocyanin
MARRSVLPVLVAVVGALLSSGAAAAGEIQGRVLLNSPAPAAKKMPVTIDQYVCGNEKDAGDLVVTDAREIRNVVVWLENPPPGAPAVAPAESPQMDQKECVFTPRVVLVPARGTVDFLNSDRLLHNLHSAPRDNPMFNRAQPKGRTIPITFAKPEIIRVDCDLHSWMRGWVVVTDHPFYAVSDEKGRIRLANVPPGHYTLQIWHERLGRSSQKITVGDGAALVTIELGLR